MFLLAAELALFERLTGAPLDRQGRPQVGQDGLPLNRTIFGPPGVGRLPSYGMRIPGFSAPYTGAGGLSSSSPDQSRLYVEGVSKTGFRNVPVFDVNRTGRDYATIWPCVTFQIISVDFNPVTYLFSDPIQGDDPAVPYATIQNGRGEDIQSGPVQLKSRPTPDEWDVTFLVTAWARSPVELRLLAAQIIYTLPPRGGLEVQLMDGTSHVCDLLYERSQQVTGWEAQMTQGPEEQREYGMAFVYRLETYVDNSANLYGVTDNRTLQTVQDRLLSLADAQGNLVENEYSLNAGELTAI